MIARRMLPISIILWVIISLIALALLRTKWTTESILAGSIPPGLFIPLLPVLLLARRAE
jgi:hypothetical protein